MTTAVKMMEKAIDMPNDKGFAYLQKERAHARNVAIGTAIAATVAVVALVVLAIFLPFLSLPFLIGVSLAAASLLGLGITAVVYCERSIEISDLFAFIKKSAEEKKKGKEV